MVRFGKPVYFQPARFHVTFARVVFAPGTNAGTNAGASGSNAPEKRAALATAAVVAGEEESTAAAVAAAAAVVDVVTCDVCAVQGKAGHLRFTSGLSG